MKSMACKQQDVKETASSSCSRMLVVRTVPGEDQLSLRYVLKGKEHNLLRYKEEALGKTLKRMCITAVRPEKLKRSQRRLVQQQTSHADTIEAHLLAGSRKVPEDTPNSEAWLDGRTLVVDDVHFSVHVNYPTILSLRMPRFIMTNCPAVPEVEMEFADCDSSEWTWKRYPLVSDPTTPLADSSTLPTICKGYVYWPTDVDLEHRLLVECTPASQECSGSTSFTVSPVVTSGPTVTPITRRHLLTPGRLAAPDEFRVVTYNTLAEPFTATTYAHEILYPYCDPSALDIDYRQSVIVHELLGYNADVICLQEVDLKSFQRFICPSMKDKGYEGYHQQKSGMIHEGAAIFFDTSKFALVSRESASLNDFFETDQSCSSLCEGLKNAPYFFREVTKKHTIILSLILRSLEMPDHYLFVGTTHLYYHPKGDHVRLAQVAIALNFLASKLEKFLHSVGSQAKVATVLCGDFNSCPCIAAYEYMVKGRISRHHRDWMVYKLSEVPHCNCNSKQSLKQKESSSSDESGDEEDSASNNPEASRYKRRPSKVDNFKGLDLRHNFHFQNAYGSSHYTNFTPGYSGVLDYIFIDSDHLSVTRAVPFPSHEEVTEFVALPSVYFPSDHLALITDLMWK